MPDKEAANSSQLTVVLGCARSPRVPDHLRRVIPRLRLRCGNRREELQPSGLPGVSPRAPSEQLNHP
eukprot:4193493-Alexandrium_andersonii.AAC.1